MYLYYPYSTQSMPSFHFHLFHPLPADISQYPIGKDQAELLAEHVITQVADSHLIMKWSLQSNLLLCLKNALAFDLN